MKNQQTVLLQMARVMVFGDSAKHPVPTRVLFDNGSQLSYNTDHLMKQLNLKPKKVERIHLNTFGVTGYKTQSCQMVELSLQKPGLKEIVTISALSSPVICSALPSAVDTRSYTHLNELPLADSGIDDKDSIDILVGCNYYWSTVTGELRRGDGEAGPVAVSRKFGWLLSGPMPTLSIILSCLTPMLL